MHTWRILHDGYPLAQAKGKFEAVTRLVRHLSENNLEGQWQNLMGGDIRVIIHQEQYYQTFTIEREEAP